MSQDVGIRSAFGHCGLRFRLGDGRPIANDPTATSARSIIPPWYKSPGDAGAFVSDFEEISTSRRPDRPS